MKKEFVIPMISVFVALLMTGSLIAAAQPTHQNGTISSIQNGPDDKPAWKASGTWNITYQSSESFGTFNASFEMMKLDGSSAHKHTISATMTSADFKVTGKTSTRIYSGTSTISMKEGPVSNVPIAIKLSSDDKISNA